MTVTPSRGGTTRGLRTLRRPDGILEVSLLGEFQSALRDTFHILDFNSIPGDFDNALLPALSGSLAWDSLALLTDRTIPVVPEPASVAMAVTGLAAVVGGEGHESYALPFRPPLLPRRSGRNLRIQPASQCSDSQSPSVTYDGW